MHQSAQNQHLLVEPIDFENFILKNKTLIQNDPQRELLLYPNDDVSVRNSKAWRVLLHHEFVLFTFQTFVVIQQVVLPRKFRTTLPGIPALTPKLLYDDAPPTTPIATVANVAAADTISKSKSILSTNSSSDDETYVSAASSETNLAGCPATRSASTCSSTMDSAMTAALNGSSSTGTGSCAANANGLLLTRQALHTYHSNSHLVLYKYGQYGRTHAELPKLSMLTDELRDEVYEIDTDPDRIDEQMSRSQADTITKQGYLLKGPDTSSDRIFVHIGSKSFKRRYCYLRQEVDGTYILELHKDKEKLGDAKTTYVMDFCTAVVPNHKRGRFCFELCMTAGHKSVTLAAEGEDDLADWLDKLTAVVQQHQALENKRIASLERAQHPSLPAQSASPAAAQSAAMMFGTLKGLDQSMNPQLIRYGRETDVSIAQARRDGRRRLFNVYRTSPTRGLLSSSSLQTVVSTPDVEPYRERFGQRIQLKAENLRFRLQAPLPGENGDTATAPAADTLRQVEPYLTSLALYDAKAGRKLTENFYFDINDDCVRDLFATAAKADHHRPSLTPSQQSLPGYDWRDQLPAAWFRHPRHALLSVTAPHPDIFVVVKIDKLLQGNINSAAEPYLKASKDPKLALKLHRSALLYNQKIGRYRMPFAWAARPLFRLYSSELDTTTTEFPAIYRQETNRLRDEDLLRLLAEYRKPDKFSKLTVVPGWLHLTVQSVPATEHPKRKCHDASYLLINVVC